MTYKTGNNIRRAVVLEGRNAHGHAGDDGDAAEHGDKSPEGNEDIPHGPGLLMSVPEEAGNRPREPVPSRRGEPWVDIPIDVEMPPVIIQPGFGMRSMRRRHGGFKRANGRIKGTSQEKNAWFMDQKNGTNAGDRSISPTTRLRSYGVSAQAERRPSPAHGDTTLQWRDSVQGIKTQAKRERGVHTRDGRRFITTTRRIFAKFTPEPSQVE